MITFINSVFNAQGTGPKDNKTPGVILKGSEDVLIKDCTFASTGYSAIYNNCSGNVVIDNCVFDCAKNYNPIEGSQSIDNGNVTVKNCVFNGKPGNNFINFYQFADGSEHLISNCSFNPSVDNNVVRVSNRTSAATKIVVEDCKYNFLPGEATDYTGFMLLQDYTNKSGTKQDFSKVFVELRNVDCDGKKVTADGAVKGSIYYVYEDGAGIITGTNDPAIIIK